MPLYALLSGWAQQVTILYTQDPLTIGIYGIPQGVGLEFGAVIAGLLVKAVGHTNLQLVASAFFTTLFVALMAILTPDNVNPAFAFLLLGCGAMNYLQITAMVMAQLGVEHRDLAKATGILSIARNAGGAISGMSFRVGSFTHKYFVLTHLVLSGHVLLDIALPSLRRTTQKGDEHPSEPRTARIFDSYGSPRGGNFQYNHDQRSRRGNSRYCRSSRLCWQIGICCIIPVSLTHVDSQALHLTTDARFDSVIYFVSLGIGIVSIIAAYFTHDMLPRMTDTIQVDLHEKDHARFFKPAKVAGLATDGPPLTDAK